MTYGKAKERDMIRSVLPSTARKGVRDDLTIVKRNARREARQHCRNITTDPEAWDGCVEIYDYPDSRINEIVIDRRGSDNISALRRWAPSQVEGVRPMDALSKIKAILPSNTIGRHAVTHVDDLPAFEVLTVEDYRYGWHTYRRHNDRIPFDYERVRGELLLILETPGAHRRLNGQLLRWYRAYEKYDPNKAFPPRRHNWKTTGRYLKGAHDIDAFMEEYKFFYHDLRVAIDKVLEK